MAVATNAPVTVMQGWEQVYQANQERLFDAGHALSAVHVAFALSKCTDRLESVVNKVIFIPDILKTVSPSGFDGIPATAIFRIVRRVIFYATDGPAATTMLVYDLFNALADIYRIICEEAGHDQANRCVFLAKLVYAVAAILNVRPSAILESCGDEDTIRRCKTLWQETIHFGGRHVKTSKKKFFGD